MSEEIQLTAEQAQAITSILTNPSQNFFITGKAGVGKTFLIEQLCKHFRKVVRCAPTGMAAILSGGATIHSTFRIAPGPLGPDDGKTEKAREGKERVSELLVNADLLIFDEISMVRSDLFQYVIDIINAYKPNLQLIAVGDFYQLEPVLRKFDKKQPTEEYLVLKSAWKKIFPDDFRTFCFDTPAWQSCNFQKIELQNIVRQKDIAFIEALNQARIGDTQCLNYFNNLKKDSNSKGIILTPTQNDAENINYIELGKIQGETFIFKASIGSYNNEDKFNSNEFPTQEKLELKKGCRVMSVKNTDYAINGDFGTVTEIEEDCISVNWDRLDFEVSVKPEKWEKFKFEFNKEKKVIEQVPVAYFTQLPLKLAYAITIHKSQGQTYESCSIKTGMFAHGQAYVALSRIRNPENLRIIGTLKDKDLIVNDAVKAFMENDKCYVAPKVDIIEPILIEGQKSSEPKKEILKKAPQSRGKNDTKKTENLKKNPQSKGHGGARSGAGRKYKFNSDAFDIGGTVKRSIPAFAVKAVDDFILDLIAKLEKMNDLERQNWIENNK